MRIKRITLGKKTKTRAKLGFIAVSLLDAVRIKRKNK
jgi:hypothetical protein